MNVFFTTPFAGKSKYQLYIDEIVRVISNDNRLITPEDTGKYLASIDDYEKQGLNRNHAHYAFIRQGIASADVVIIEASEEDIRVGHELTLALLFHKPTLVLSQHQDYSLYITHDLLQGAVYKNVTELGEIVRDFLRTSQTGRPEATMQTIDTSADSLHSVALARLRQLAKQEAGQFGEWARQAEGHPDVVAKEIQSKLGKLKKNPAWSVFAPIYNEDSPDYIQSGVAKFVEAIAAKYKIDKDELVVEAACGTAALARQLASRGFHTLQVFDNSRPMLSEAFRLCAGYPQIEIFEADVESLKLSKPAQLIVWTDYSSNFAMTKQQLKRILNNLVANIAQGGLLIFDIRTYQGWQIDFYAQPITTFATERFQRLWLNDQDYEKAVINFDVFIRTRDTDGAWSEWRRESMTEKMWRLEEVISTIASLHNVDIDAVYGDDFRVIDARKEVTNLAYFVLKKQ